MGGESCSVLILTLMRKLAMSRIASGWENFVWPLLITATPLFTMINYCQDWTRKQAQAEASGEDIITAPIINNHPALL